MKYDFCTIRDYRPSTRTIDAIKEMNDTVNMSKYLASLVSVTPVFAILVGRGPISGSTVSTAWNFYNYNWDTLRDGLAGIPALERETLEKIALNETMYQMGKDYEFWICIYNAI
ncbi:hypothetical protein [Vibrio spartinae]|uniref:Uncharacterized protein n=1 Tax=Vibrio spartinae TaxID=1918945 RepID=A0ABX6QZJ7_9VIBR|nr:hypothetical protein [Vibrio spartinae]QMV14420.1 hypothetical protein Vspart_01675 [Vibrio spartinae]